MEDVCIAAPRPLRLFSPPVLHRPRPRIISAPVEAFARFTLSDPEEQDDGREPVGSPASSSTSEPEPPSAIAESLDSSTARLPEEALEEFFAILRPQVRSPPLRSASRRHGPTWVYERPHPYGRPKKSLSSTVSSSTTEDSDRDRKSRRGVGTGKMSKDSIDTPLTTEDFEWTNFELGSPISRTHTRNPLPRHPSYEHLTSNLIFSMQFSPPPRPANNPIDFAAHPVPSDP